MLIAIDAFTACVPEMAGGCATVQVGGLAAPELPVMEHARDTVPVKPPLGVTEMVAEPEPPAVTLSGEPCRENDGVVAPPVLMTYAAEATLLVPMVLLIAIAFTVSEADTAIGAV